MLIPVEAIVVVGITLDADDEIGVFTPTGICAGAARYKEGENIAVTVWGNNSMTDEVEGFVSGEAMAFILWDSEREEEFDATATYESAQATYAPNAIVIIGSLTVMRSLTPPSITLVMDVPDDNGHQLRLEWTPSPDEEYGYVDRYRIYRSRSDILTEPISLDDIADFDTLVSLEETYTILIDSVYVGTLTLEYTDRCVPLNGERYYYWIQVVGAVGESEKVSAQWVTDVADGGAPAEFRIYPPHPNPFNPATTIDYAIAERCHVLVTVYNTSGQTVAVLVDEMQRPGGHSVTWDAHDMPSGLYFLRITARGQIKTRKMTLIK